MFGNTECLGGHTSVENNIIHVLLKMFLKTFCRRAEQTSKIQGGKSCMYLSRSSAIEELWVAADSDIDRSPIPLPPQHPESSESTTINTLWAGGVKDMRGSNTALKKNQRRSLKYIIQKLRNKPAWRHNWLYSARTLIASYHY